METVDLMDQLEAVLPRMDPAQEAQEIVTVMARVIRAESAAVFVERGGALHWLAGDPLSNDAGTPIRSAWSAQQRRLLSGTAFTEAPAPALRPMHAWLMWMRRPEDAGLDVIYFAGTNLRPLRACSAPLERLAALLPGHRRVMGCDDLSGYENRIR